jgi:hypothetical protein
MIITTIDDHGRDISQVFKAKIFLRMMVIVSSDVKSLRALDRERWLSRRGRFTETAAVRPLFFPSQPLRHRASLTIL